MPMVSEEVQFVTKGARIPEKKLLQSMLLLLHPFDWKVWLALFGVLAGYTWMIRSVETNKQTPLSNQESARGH